MPILDLATRNNGIGCHQSGQSQMKSHITTPAQDRYIRVFYIRNRTVTATTTAVGISGYGKFRAQAVCNMLRSIRPRRPYVGPVLIQVHRYVHVYVSVIY